MNKKSLSIIQISSEVVPFAKTGGLADVVGALPQELQKLGHKVITILPKYRTIDEEKYQIQEITRINIHTYEGDRLIIIKQCELNDITYYFIEYNPYFDRSFLYGDQLGDYPDNLPRYTLFCLSCIELIKRLGIKPDIIHCHDWQSAFIPVYLKILYYYDPIFIDTKVVYTIHNLAYQGLFPLSQWNVLQLPYYLCSPEYMEFWGKINLMKAGLLFSDSITTVSPKYSKEIQSPEYGYGLEGVINTVKKKITGIINGIDYSIWNPSIDNALYGINYDSSKLENKELIKEKFLHNINLTYKKNVPLVGMISRLADQKGFDLISEVLDQLLKENDVYFVLLGSGDKKYQDLFEQASKKYPDKMYINLKFDDDFAHKLEAASDIFMMPSKYEPCGLSQLISLKYGTIPVVRATGGLADTIINNVNGFSFAEYSATALYSTLKKAFTLFKNDKDKWKTLQLNGIKQDWSWANSSNEYEKLFLKLTK